MALLVGHFCAYPAAVFLVLSLLTAVSFILVHQCGWPTADRQDVKSTGSRPRRGLRGPSVLHRGIVVVALGTQTQPRVAPMTMVAAQKRAEMPSCPANGCLHASQRLSASGVASAEWSVLVGLGAVTSLTCPSSCTRSVAVAALRWKG
jgi:hypothetical protein